MEYFSRARFLNVMLRMATLGSRFLFVFFLAKLLQPNQLGLYGIFTATVGYSLYFLGFDFYMFTTRELIKSTRGEWGVILKSQGAFFLMLYAIVLPLLVFIFITELLPWFLVGWFFVILILEHLNQEISRLMIAISKQLFASVLLFMRQGTWAIAIVALMLANPNTRSLHYVFAAWALAGLLTISIGVFQLNRLRIGGWNKDVDWRWIRKGAGVSIKLLLATLAIRAIFTLDRYWVNYLSDLDVVGAYVLFIGVGGIMTAFLDAGVFSFIYPGLINAHVNNRPDLFRKNFKILFFNSSLVILLFISSSWLLMPHLLAWLNKPIYHAHLYLYPWLLAAMTLHSLSMIPHFAIYAQGIDRPIIQSHILGLICFVLATWITSKFFPSLAVPIGMCAGLAFVLLWKAFAFFKFTPLRYRYIWYRN